MTFRNLAAVGVNDLPLLLLQYVHTGGAGGKRKKRCRGRDALYAPSVRYISELAFTPSTFSPTLTHRATDHTHIVWMDEMELGGLTSLRGVEQRDLASAQLQEGKGKKINNALAQKDCQWWLSHTPKEFGSPSRFLSMPGSGKQPSWADTACLLRLLRLLKKIFAEDAETNWRSALHPPTYTITTSHIGY